MIAALQTGTSTAVARLGALALFTLGSCGLNVLGSDAATTVNAAPALQKSASDPTHQVPLHAASTAHQVPTVGGCSSECADPRTAVMRFLEATASETGTDAAARFIDSTRLVLDGRTLGTRWAGLWQNGESATRRAEIDEVVTDLAGWTKGRSHAQVAGALATGPAIVKNWSSEARFLFLPPGAPPWTLVLAPRGVEWLLIEIRRNLEATQ